MQMTWQCIGWGLLAMAAMTGGARGGTAAPAARWVKTEIFFGADRPGGAWVAPQEWAAFLDREITPRFPKGLTVYEAYGQMQHARGTIEKQTTRVVLLVHPDEPAVHRQIHDLIKAYQDQFKHAQVMHLHSSVQAEFLAD